MIGRVLRNNSIAKNTYEMVMEIPSEEGMRIIPGQFINIKVEGFYLRRPISICDWKENTITVIYKVVGDGTEGMSKIGEGSALDIIIPLGNGCRIDRSGKRPLLIGGGAGVPPMFGLCKKLVEAGKKPIAVLGFGTKDEIFYVNKFEEIGAEVLVSTVDGSEGVKGFVTYVIENLKYTSFYACGPEGMLKAVDETVPKEIPGWFSFEERMGCGFGACMGCSCETKYGSKRICKDGPVLERGEVIW